MTNIGKVILFDAYAQDGNAGAELSLHSTGGGGMNVRLYLDLKHELHNSSVYKHMWKEGNWLYPPFKLVRAPTLAEVEANLKIADYWQAWIVIFAEPTMDEVPVLHEELFEFLWHPHANLPNPYNPPMVMVLGYEEHTQPPADGASCDTPNASGRSQSTEIKRLSLKEQYENCLHVKFCCSSEEVLNFFRLGGQNVNRYAHEEKKKAI